MEELKCKNCGSTDVVKGENGIFFCKTCGSTFKENTENSNSNKVAYLKDQLEELLSTENIYKVEQNGLFGNSEYVALKIADEILQYDFNYADAWLVKAKILSKTFFHASNPLRGITCEEMVANYNSFMKYIKKYLENKNIEESEKKEIVKSVVKQLFFNDIIKEMDYNKVIDNCPFGSSFQGQHKPYIDYKIYLSNFKIKQYIVFLKQKEVKDIIEKIGDCMTEEYCKLFAKIILEYFRNDARISKKYNFNSEKLYIKNNDVNNTKETWDKIMSVIKEYKTMVLDLINFINEEGGQKKEFYNVLIYLSEIYIKIFYEDDESFYCTEIAEDEKKSILEEIEEYKKML